MDSGVEPGRDPVYVGRRQFEGNSGLMAIIAMKFGGTSVADLPRIRHVAELVKREVERGNQVAVVVSAMAGETNKLVAWTNEAAKPSVEGIGGKIMQAIPDQREYDVV